MDDILCRRYSLANNAFYKHSEEYLLKRGKMIPCGQVNVERQLIKEKKVRISFGYIAMVNRMD
jgi:hypothetical protein